MRKEGREHQVEISDSLGEGMQNRCKSFTLFGRLELEGLGVGDVLVGFTDQSHRFRECGLLTVVTDQVTDGFEAFVDFVQ